MNIKFGETVCVRGGNSPVLVVDVSPPLRSSTGEPTRLVTIAWKDPAGRVGEYTAPHTDFVPVEPKQLS